MRIGPLLNKLHGKYWYLVDANINPLRHIDNKTARNWIMKVLERTWVMTFVAVIASMFAFGFPTTQIIILTASVLFTYMIFFSAQQGGNCLVKVYEVIKE